MNLTILFLTVLSLALFTSATPVEHEQLKQRHQEHRNHTKTNIQSTHIPKENNDQKEPQVTATLDYGTFKGSYSSEFNITYFQKIPFAAPPVGQNRFRGPQPPLNLTTHHGPGYIYNSSESFDMCPQRTSNGSEDCLYLGLYSRPWFPNTSQPLRPVVIVFYGGGFIRGSASFSTLPPSAYPVLNVSSENDLLFIYPNYRTNAFGFLAGKEIVADYPNSDTNVGLLDQRAAILWARKYVAHFGGDPADISIWGQSAGGGSVVAQVIADQEYEDFDGVSASLKGGEGKWKLFQKALVSSPYWPKTYSATGPEAQWIYDTLVNMTGCASSGRDRDQAVDHTLSCLKALPLQTILNAAEYIASSHTYTTSSYTFAPVIDGRFLPRTLTQATETENLLINADKILATYNTHEGENFLPPLLHADEDEEESKPPTEGSVSFTNWIKGFLPDLTAQDNALVKNMYPPSGKTETVANYSTVTVRAGLIYRDVVLACPGYWLTAAASSSASVTDDTGRDGGGYLAEYTIPPAKHASEVDWWNTPTPKQKSSPLVFQGFVGAFASFFATGDPNKRKLTSPEIPGLPESGETGEEFIIQADGFTTSGIAHLKRRCDFWRGLAPRISI